MAIILLETAFIFTSFLPGDSLLFLLGITIAAASHSSMPIIPAIAGVLVCAVLGSQIGFEVGLRVGHPLFERGHGLILNPRVLAQTHGLFEKYGARAIILARFVPIVRALVPMLAGITEMPRRQFLRFNAMGASLWVVGFMCLGYFAGNVPVIKQHLEATVLVIVVLSSLPMPAELLRVWLQKRKQGIK